MTDRLFHYTCDHGAESIRRMGYIAPSWHPLLGVPIAWFTDMPQPDADALGLTSVSLDCDRTSHRFEVAPGPPVFKWSESPFVASLPVSKRWSLHAGVVDPSRWWASMRSVVILGQTAEVAT